MTTRLQEILNKARRFKACAKVDGISDAKSAIDTLLSPQGREFALNANYPSLESLRSMSEELRKDDRVYLDSGSCLTNAYDTLAAGDTVLMVDASLLGNIYHVVVMDGADVTVRASKYAVVCVTHIGGDVKVDNDGTAFVTMESR